MKTITRYLVKNAKGEYQSAYSTKLGKDNAFKYATLTARDIFGVIFAIDENGDEKEIASYPKPQPKKKKQKIAQKAV
tara:strand:+ start:4190 stop:4420 length:231 start_codon:yes stop_codon:yes gene_type:complete